MARTTSGGCGGRGSRTSPDRVFRSEVREYGCVAHEEGDRDEEDDTADHDRDDGLKEGPEILDDELDLLFILIGHRQHHFRDSPRLLAGLDERRYVGWEAIRKFEAGAEGFS